MRGIACAGASDAIAGMNVGNGFMYRNHRPRTAVPNRQRLVKAAAYSLHCGEEPVAADFVDYFANQVRARAGLLK